MYFHNVVGTGSYTTSTTNMYHKDRFHVPGFRCVAHRFTCLDNSLLCLSSPNIRAHFNPHSYLKQIHQIKSVSKTVSVSKINLQTHQIQVLERPNTAATCTRAIRTTFSRPRARPWLHRLSPTARNFWATPATNPTQFQRRRRPPNANAPCGNARPNDWTEGAPPCLCRPRAPTCCRPTNGPGLACSAPLPWSIVSV